MALTVIRIDRRAARSVTSERGGLSPYRAAEQWLLLLLLLLLYIIKRGEK
jgi:hypothetical protein